MADEAVNRIGAILEELGARFDLVVEAVSGFGGRLDTLRDEIFGQFAEVGPEGMLGTLTELPPNGGSPGGYFSCVAANRSGAALIGDRYPE